MPNFRTNSEDRSSERKTDLKRSAIRSGYWIFIRFAGRQLTNSLTFIALAFFMSPVQYGIGSIAVSLVLVLRICLVRGLRDVIIQSAELEPLIEDTAWWLNFGLGVVLTTIVLVSAPVVSYVYSEPALTWLIALSAPTLLFAGASAVQEARLERDFKHHMLTYSQGFSSIAAAIVAIFFAWRGYGALSLVAYMAIESFGIMVATFAQSRWFPGKNFSFSTARKQLGFGVPLMLSFTLTTGNLRIAQLIIGFLVGAEATAFFRVASQVNQLLTQSLAAPAMSVLLPAFSRSSSDRSSQFTRSLAVLSFISLPAFLGMAAVSPIALPLALGPQWAPSGTIAGVLCFAVFAQLPLQVLNPMLIAMGKPKRAAAISMGSVAVGLLATAVGAALAGGVGAAIGFSARAIITVPGGAIAILTLIGASISSQLRALAASAFPALLTYILAMTLIQITDQLTKPWVSILIATSAGAFLYLSIFRFVVRYIFKVEYAAVKEIFPTKLGRYL